MLEVPKLPFGLAVVIVVVICGPLQLVDGTTETHLWGKLFGSLLRTPAGKLDRCRPRDLPKCALRDKPRRIAVVAFFAHEVDTLEIALTEYSGLADVIITESQRPHHFLEKQAKPLVWPMVRDTPRFRHFKNVSFLECNVSTSSTGNEIFRAEAAINNCASDYLKTIQDQYDIVIVGTGVDEILSHAAIAKLKYCQDLPTLPTSVVITMFMGRADRTFRSDWHFPQYPYSLDLPTVYPANWAGSFGPLRLPTGDVRRAPMGGAHMTNYCYLPNMVLKGQTASEYKHALNTTAKLCAVPLAAQKDECYRMLAARTKPVSADDPAFVLPEAVACNLDRFPAWFGKTDPRETVLFDELCSPPKDG